MTKPLILFDLTRLLSASGRSAPTGIERVEYAYARWLLESGAAHVRFVVTMSSSVRLIADNAVPAFLDKQFAIWGEGAKGFSAAKAIENINRFLRGTGAPPAPKFGHMSPEERQQRRDKDTVAAAAKPWATWAQQMAASWAREPLGPLVRRHSGRRPIVYLRTSMDKMERPEPLAQLKELPNLKMVAFCHDIIPLDYPEYVRPAAVKQYAERVQTLAQLSDGVILASKYNASRLSPLLFPNRPRLTVSPIGIDVPPPPAPDSLPPLVDEPFFLVVSTIEARKNHFLLLNLWRRLVADLGAAAPKLVIVGKRGWEAQTPLAILDRARELAPYVYEAGAVPDEALNLLRRRATAVLMPSFVEGFGLPVLEALAVDTPVIASDIPVFRELVGNSAELLDPLDGPSWRRAILDYAKAGSGRREAALTRARSFTPPSWSSHFGAVETLIDGLTGAAEPGFAEKARQALGSASSFGYPGAAVAWDGRSDGRRA